MGIHVSKDGQQYGPYSLEELKSYLESGQFAENDFGLTEGGTEWQQLGEMLSTADATSAGEEKSIEEEDVDYEKLKQWEGQFEDFEDEEDTAEAPIASPPAQAPPLTAPTTPPVQQAPPAEPVYAQPPPQKSAPVAASPSDVSAPPPAQPSKSVDDPDEEPAPSRRKRRRQQEADDYDDFDDEPRPRQRKGGRRQSGSRKMSGMNKGQTVIVVKGAGIGSKIFTALIVLFVISLIVGIIGFGAYFAAPQVVGPILKNLGIPVEIPAVQKETPAPAPSAQAEDGAASFAAIILTDDHIQSLRSTGLEFFKSSDGKGLHCVASVEPDLGLNDEDLPAIEVLAQKIVWLDLSKGNLTDLAVSRLSKIPNLRNLYLEDNKGITSRGVSGLSGLSKLKCLNLVGTSLDDSVVDALSVMTSLKEVYLWRSGLSAEALQKLRDVRPDMLVQAG
ncbi:MAG: DUF4339 domain-containing protein [Opitutae bacterium]|nr:DUF4339 domain-containing protein [Opitutae bacterium]MBT6850428.1 DUF4339 domain-containing protein [Opitutae bacterium]MBT7741862.1 DUF4339 domain-containing protein [Opitutae bacterium]